MILLATETGVFIYDSLDNAQKTTGDGMIGWLFWNYNTIDIMQDMMGGFRFPAIDLYITKGSQLIHDKPKIKMVTNVEEFIKKIKTEVLDKREANI
jgi:hypothetical protein